MSTVSYSQSPFFILSFFVSPLFMYTNERLFGPFAVLAFAAATSFRLFISEVGMLSLFFVLIGCAVGALAIVRVAALRRRIHSPADRKTPTKSIGFVHPAAGGGGGGERVLWVAVKAILDDDAANDVKRTVVVYTNPYLSKGAPADSEATAASLFALVQEQFGIVLPADTVVIKFLRRSMTDWMDSKRYPRLTLVLQSVLGGCALGCEVLRVGVCDVLVDTVGVAFAFPFYRFLGGATVLAYVHYPTVSTDMISRVATGKEGYNNTGAIARNRFLTQTKIWYYRFFAWMYWAVGCCCSNAVANSSWTQRHLAALWGGSPATVFPPVGTAAMLRLPLAPSERTNDIVSIGQFRPEKDHALQIVAFALAVQRGRLPRDATLRLVGGVRNDDDRRRVGELRQLAATKGVSDRVVFETSVPYDRILELLGSCSIGLHAMTDEHFGIVVVEYMASGCVPLAHNSGGVCKDIVDAGVNGLLASTAEEFSLGIESLLAAKQHPSETVGGNPWSFGALQAAARRKCVKFSDDAFARTLLAQWRPFF